MGSALAAAALARPGSTGLAALLAAHRPELLRFLIARTGNQSEAEDLIQELWLRLHQSTPGPVSNGRAYLFQAANNLAVDRARERLRRERREQAWHDAQFGSTDPSIEAPDLRSDAQGMLEEREEIELLASALAKLPEGAQRAIRLHKIDGFSHAEVARQMGISRSGVEKHMAVAMRRLRQAYGTTAVAA